jgi:3-methyladenine DNA glycosylase Mpg
VNIVLGPRTGRREGQLALGITRKQNGGDLTRSALQVRGLRDEPPVEITVTPRIGITHCADWPPRFLIAGNRFVS